MLEAAGQQQFCSRSSAPASHLEQEVILALVRHRGALAGWGGRLLRCRGPGERCLESGAAWAGCQAGPDGRSGSAGSAEQRQRRCSALTASRRAGPQCSTSVLSLPSLPAQISRLEA